MVALASVLIIVLLSMLVTRVATVALSLTGMSRESARFQARSALSGVGFTTSEAEGVVDHPVRRRIILALMVLGSAGLVGAAASLILSFGGGAESSSRLVRALVLAAGLAVLLALSRSAWVDRHLARLIGRILRWRGLHVRDYGQLLALEGEWAVSELAVEPDDWLAGRTLRELKLRDEGVAVLGIHRRDGAYVGVPRGDALIEPGDLLVLYSTEARLEELDARKRGAQGDAAHERAAVAPV
jgi:K+/H+ antiporter YhaU regulatory subunit KhtT